jgi:hypothetical protein
LNIVRVIEFAKNGSEFGGQNLFHVWRIGSTSQLRGINLKDLQPQSGIYKEKIEKLKCLAAWHGLGTHGGGWGKAKLDKLDKSGALQGGTVRVRASRSWARPAPRSEFFYWLGRAANRPSSQGVHQPLRRPGSTRDCLTHHIDRDFSFLSVDRCFSVKPRPTAPIGINSMCLQVEKDCRGFPG